MSPAIALTGMKRPKRPLGTPRTSKPNTRRRNAERLVALGTLAAGIAHDLNNILAMMRGNLSIARSALGPKHAAEGELQEVEKAATRAASLVGRILNFSRPHRQTFGSFRIESAVREGL